MKISLLIVEVIIVCTFFSLDTTISWAHEPPPHKMIELAYFKCEASKSLQGGIYGKDPFKRFGPEESACKKNEWIRISHEEFKTLATQWHGMNWDNEIPWWNRELEKNYPYPCNELITCTPNTGNKIKELKKDYDELLKFIQPPIGSSRESIEAIYGKSFRYIDINEPYKGWTPEYQYRIPNQTEEDFIALISIGYDKNNINEWIEFPHPFGFLISRAEEPASDEEIVSETIKYYGICIEKFKKIKDMYYDQLKSAAWNKK